MGGFNLCLCILQIGNFSWGGGGDGEYWEMDEQICVEMEEVEWDVDCSW